jgi:hypothetical protein
VYTERHSSGVPIDVTDSTSRRALFFLLAAFLLLAFHHPAPGSGVSARLDAAMALVDPGTLSIDAYHENTHDKTAVNGRYYSDKPPLPSFLGAPAFAIARAVARTAGGPPSFRVAGYAITALTVTLLSFLLLLAIERHLARLDADGPRLFAVAAYGLGTPAWPYAVLFFGHGFSAAFGFFAYALVVRGVREETRRGGTFAAAGAFAGLAILSEYPAALIAIFLALYVAVGTKRTGDVARFAAFAFALPAALLATYNTLAFGSPLHLGYASSFLPMYDEAMGRGLFGVTLPRPGVLPAILIGPSRGLFFLAPVLLLALPGLATMVRDRRLRREGVLIAAIAVGHLLFNAAYHQPGGGTCYGPRHLVAIVPFLIVPVYVHVARVGRAGRMLAALLAVIAIAITAASTAIEPLWQERIRHPLAEFIPALAAARDHLDIVGAGALPAFPASLAPAALALAVVVGLAFSDLFRAPRPANAAPRNAGPVLAAVLIVLTYAASVPLIRTDPGVLQQALGNHYSEKGKPAEAVAAYARAAGLRRDPYIHYYQARAYLALGRAADAAAAYRAALAIDPNFPEAARVRRLIEALDHVGDR